MTFERSVPMRYISARRTWFIYLVMECLSLIFFPNLSRSQEFLGLINGNYAGTNGLMINPASMQNSKSYLHINLLSAGLFLDNNYLYLSKKEFQFFNLLNPSYKFQTHDMEYGTEVRSAYTWGSPSNKHVYNNFRINGPSAMLIYGNHAVALTTAVRNVISMVHVPYDIANFIYLGLNYKPQQGIIYEDDQTVRAAQMTWGEIGLSYAYNIYRFNFDQVTAGVTLKKLYGYSGLYLYSRELNYVVPDDSTINIINANAELGFSLPLDYNNTAFTNSNMVKGGGWGADIGFIYQRKLHSLQRNYFDHLCAQHFEDYLYRIGVSLLDFGAVTFKKQAEKHDFNNVGNYWLDVTDFKFRSISSFVDTVSTRFYGDGNASRVARKFTIWLPAAISIQADYRYTKYWYINATFICGFPVAKASLIRPAMLSVAPRYESKWFEVNLPVILYDWKYPHIGLSLRLGGLTIGTDKLGGFSKISNFEGMDVYVAIKYSFEKGSCGFRNFKRCIDMDIQ